MKIRSSALTTQNTLSFYLSNDGGATDGQLIMRTNAASLQNLNSVNSNDNVLAADAWRTIRVSVNAETEFCTYYVDGQHGYPGNAKADAYPTAAGSLKEQLSGESLTLVIKQNAVNTTDTFLLDDIRIYDIDATYRTTFAHDFENDEIGFAPKDYGVDFYQNATQAWPYRIAVAADPADPGNKVVRLTNIGSNRAANLDIRSYFQLPVRKDDFEFSFDLKIQNTAQTQMQFMLAKNYHQVIGNANDFNIISRMGINGDLMPLNSYNAAEKLGTLPEDTWVNIKIGLNYSTSTIDYYIDNVQVGQAPMDTAKYNTTFNSALYDQSEGMFFTITGRFSANTDDASIFVDNVKVTDKMVSSDRAEFLNFSVPGQMGLSLINRDINRVALRVAPGTDLTSLTPTIELPAGAACSPSAGEAVDFTTPVTYTITNGGVVEEWTVTVDGSPAELVIDDTFDSTYGNADLNNWRYVGEVVNTFADDALGLNKAQKMPNPNGWAMDFQRTFDTAQSGTVLLESRLKVSALDAGLVIPQINGSGLDELAYTDGLASVKVNADGTLTLAGKTEMTVPGGTVTADTYFDLHILADTQTGRATAWIGEEMPADPEYVEMNFATRGIGNVAYTVLGSLTDGITLDYVRIVNTTPVSISATRVVTDGTDRSTYSTLRHSGETVLTASVKNRTGTAQRVSLIAALYGQAREGEETGDLSAVYMQAAEIPANTAEDVAVTVPLPDYATENSLQILLWSDINKVESLVYPIEKPVQTYQQLAPANIFSDGAVLQQGKPIKVFGKASDTTEVTVAFAGETRTVTPVNQEWSVEFPAQDATFEPQTMEISTAGDAYHPAEHRTISDILIGEVWMISGQSNVEYAGYGVTNPNVKMFDVQKLIDYSYADRNAREARDDISETWKPLSTSYSGSYIGIHYANLLQQKLNVPVGMIVCAFGGTPIASFMNPETLDDDPAFASLLNDYNSSLADPDMALTNGSPSVLYETMLSSVIGYPLSGVLWYQGENEMQIDRYEKQITNMIADWRASWDCGDFPFYIVQLPRYDGNHYADWAAMRAMQYRVANSVPNCDIVCTIDLGEAQNIHPADKMPIAERLATLALATYYQTSPEKDAEYSGPRVQSATADGGTVTLAFTHTGSGLKSLNTNGTLTGFEIAGTDGTYYPAEATIDGETVVLTCTQVAQPATVRYAWTWFPEVSLGNAEGYPAFPFELAIAN